MISMTRMFITETWRMPYNLFMIKALGHPILGQNYKVIYKSAFSQDFAVSMISLTHSFPSGKQY